jgi:hypothetical protein
LVNRRVEPSAGLHIRVYPCAVDLLPRPLDHHAGPARALGTAETTCGFRA